MRYKELISEASIGDVAKKWQYYLTGTGGTKAAEVMFQDDFLKKFNQRTKLAIDSAKSSGVLASENDIKKIANNFLMNYKWEADADQQENLDRLSNLVAQKPSSANIDKLGNYLYYIGRQQQGQGKREPTLGEPSSNQEKLGSSTQQVIASINKLTGSSNFDDLEAIAKTAMTLLYKQNPSAYTKLYREITGTANTAQDDDNPNIVRGYNESKNYKKKK
jgi:hypothetical protein